MSSKSRRRKIRLQDPVGDINYLTLDGTCMNVGASQKLWILIFKHKINEKIAYYSHNACTASVGIGTATLYDSEAIAERARRGMKEGMDQAFVIVNLFDHVEALYRAKAGLGAKPAEAAKVDGA